MAELWHKFLSIRFGQAGNLLYCGKKLSVAPKPKDYDDKNSNGLDL
jgi:hypothetical protein